MNIRIEIRESMDSLFQHKLRTLLTLLGIIFGVGAVIAMLSIGKGAEQEALELIDSMGLRNIIVKGKMFEEARLKEIRENSLGLSLQDLSSVLDTLPLLSASSAGKQIKTYALFSGHGESEAEVWGVTSSYQDLANIQITEGRFLLPTDDQIQSSVCVIGSRVAQVLFPSQPALGRPIKINQVWMRVVGVIKDRNLARDDFQGVSLKGEQNKIYLPLQTALRRFAFKPLENEIDEFRVQLRPGESSATAAASIDYLLQKRHKGSADYELVVPEALLDQNRKTQNIFTIVMACIAGISLLVGGMGVMNIMLASVLERTAEIGLRRALGATERDIQRQFLLETFTVSSVGGLIGILFGFFLSGAIAFFAGWAVGWSLWAIILSVGVCSLVGLVFGIYPAVKASRLNPIEALRHD